MSKMGRAVEWIQENGFEGRPDALELYIKYLSEQKPVTKNESLEKNITEESE
jgi:hypothetical protein